MRGDVHAEPRRVVVQRDAVVRLRVDALDVRQVLRGEPDDVAERKPLHDVVAAQHHPHLPIGGVDVEIAEPQRALLNDRIELRVLVVVDILDAVRIGRDAAAFRLIRKEERAAIGGGRNVGLGYRFVVRRIDHHEEREVLADVGAERQVRVRDLDLPLPAEGLLLAAVGDRGEHEIHPELERVRAERQRRRLGSVGVGGLRERRARDKEAAGQGERGFHDGEERAGHGVCDRARPL